MRAHSKRHGSQMFAKLGFAAVALLTVVTTARSVDLHKTYDEMYPANGLKREVFTLCHDTDPLFIRAVKADREACFERIPSNIAMVIGWTHRGTGRSAPPLYSGTLEAAEVMLMEVALRGGSFGGGAIFAAAPPCRETDQEATARAVAAAFARDAARGGNAKEPLLANPPATLPNDKRLPILALTGAVAPNETAPLRIRAGADSAPPPLAAPQAAAIPSNDLGGTEDAPVSPSPMPDRCAPGA